MFDGDWHLALASYNGGPGRVQRAMKRGGVDDFWKLAAKPRLLPRETREYVPMILAAIVIARNPAQYGFESSKPEPAPAYEQDSRCPVPWTCGASPNGPGPRSTRFRRSTPNCGAGRRRVRDEPYQLKVPAGTAERITADWSRRPRPSSRR